MPKPVKDSEIIRILREEWTAKKERLREDTEPKSTGVNFQTASPGLKVKAKSSGILYTVLKVEPGVVTVKNPEGVPSMLSNETLEKEFELA